MSKQEKQPDAIIRIAGDVWLAASLLEEAGIEVISFSLVGSNMVIKTPKTKKKS